MMIEKMAEILKDYSHHCHSMTLNHTPLIKNIAKKMEEGKELVFILPAFPAKSSSPDKTCGELPDLGEVIALQSLQEMCTRLSEVYAQGAKVIICSDGRVFSDVVKVSDLSIDRYNTGIKSIIAEYKLTSLSVFSMDDLFPESTPDELRDMLLVEHAKSVDHVRNLVMTNENYNTLFNGVHRFLLEDEIAINKTDSKNAISRETKKRTYELIRRSDAWSNLLDKYFEGELRLSIHPYPIGHEKFGVKLVPSSSKWATPWHNVVVRVKNSFELMHLKEAMKLNAVLKMEKDKYAYFEIPSFQ